VDREAGDARAKAAAAAAALTMVALDVSAADELHIQLQTLQGRLDQSELARVNETHAAASEHSEQLHRLHHQLAAAELQVLASRLLTPHLLLRSV
jgi:hypothetical protein